MVNGLVKSTFLAHLKNTLKSASKPKSHRRREVFVFKIYAWNLFRISMFEFCIFPYSLWFLICTSAQYCQLPPSYHRGWAKPFSHLASAPNRSFAISGLFSATLVVSPGSVSRSNSIAGKSISRFSFSGSATIRINFHLPFRTAAARHNRQNRYSCGNPFFSPVRNGRRSTPSSRLPWCFPFYA